MRKKIKCLFWIPITNRCNFQLSFGCTHLRVRWGHARRHGKRSLEMLTVERADYTQEITGLSLLQFLVSTWMKRLQIMVSIDGSVKHCSFWNICNICRVLSAHAVGRAWTGNSRTDSPSNRFYASLATRMFPLPWIKTVFFFLHSDNRTTADSWKCCTTVHFTDLVSNRF